MTDMQKSDEVVLKTDSKGRIQTPAARREQLLDEFERSGLSAAKYAALLGIKYQTFATWAARRRKARPPQTPAAPSDPVRWLEAVVQEASTPPATAAATLTLHLPGGAHLELAHPQQLPLAAALLRALAQPC